MRLRSLIVLSILASLAVLVPVSHAAAAQATGWTTSMGSADTVHNTQRVTETLAHHALGEVAYATFRAVDPAKVQVPDGKCPATMATNLDGRIFGPTRITKSVFKASAVLSLHLYLVCEYASRDGSLDPAKAALAAGALLGQFYPGAGAGPTKATKVSVKAKHSGAKEILTGAATGPATGVVVVQLRSGSHWRSLTGFPLQHGKFSGHVAYRHGQVLRVVRLAAVGWRAGGSSALRVH